MSPWSTEARRGVPRVAFVGAFNSGKSSLINALVAHDVLPTNPVPSTARPTLLGYLDYSDQCVLLQDGTSRAIAASDLATVVDKSLYGFDPSAAVREVHVGRPHPILRAYHLLDLPGYGDPRVVPVDAARYLQQCCSVVVCVSATATWTETDAAHFDRLSKAAKRTAIVAVTKADSLNDEGQTARIASKVAESVPVAPSQVVVLSNVHKLPVGDATGVPALKAALERAVVLAPAVKAIAEAEDCLEALLGDGIGVAEVVAKTILAELAFLRSIDHGAATHAWTASALRQASSKLGKVVAALAFAEERRAADAESQLRAACEQEFLEFKGLLSASGRQR